jgi:hypothetical protein
MFAGLERIGGILSDIEDGRGRIPRPPNYNCSYRKSEGPAINSISCNPTPGGFQKSEAWAQDEARKQDPGAAALSRLWLFVDQ